MTTWAVWFESIQETYADALLVDELCPDDAVRIACEIAWSARDGWEWMSEGARRIGCCPQHTPDRTTYYCMTVDYDPVFSVREANE